ncbi:MAG: ABC transporter ATP-binding protein [Candidatus Aminicenantes bacterium]|nr:ABC transporter ATP-binding protein [Candidatus Aminicenantes bacterium]
MKGFIKAFKSNILVLLIKDLIHSSKKYFYLALTLMIIHGLVQGFGLIMLIPLIKLFNTDSIYSSNSKPVNTLIKIFDSIHIPLTLANLLIAFIIIIAAVAFIHRGLSIIDMRLETRFVRSMRNRLYYSLTYAKWSFIIQKKLSDIASVLTNELQRSGTCTQHILILFSNTFFALIYVAIAFMLSVPLTAVTLCVLIFFFILLRSKNNAVTETGKSIHYQTQKLYSAIIEHLSGLKLAKSNIAEEKHIKHFNKINSEIEKKYIRFTQIKSNSRMIIQIGAGIFLCLFVYTSQNYFHLSITEIFLLIIIISRLFPRFSLIQQSIHQIMNMLPAYSSVINLLKESVDEKEIRLKQSHKKIEFKRSLEFRNIYFKYKNQKSSFSLNNINFTIPFKRTTAIIGESGSGKTTIADLIIGLIIPQKGNILIDGIILNANHLREWRRLIGYVPQDNFLFHDTIRNNLIWANQHATDEDIWHSLEIMEAAKFIKNLPHGLDTSIGDRGVRISVGERQRIILARTLIKNPKLLILDEATSAIDPKNEKYIFNALARLHGKLTIILISHKSSVIETADNIIHMNKGTILSQNA